MVKRVYEAIAEDLTHLGGPMGSEHTTEESLGLFSSRVKAQASCEKDYKGKLRFFRPPGKTRWRTKDLGWVMYHIRAREIA